MKFEEIIAGAVENPTNEQVKDAIIESLSECKSIDDINDFLVKMHPSDAYTTITDYIKPKSNMVILYAKNNNVEGYQKFQDIQRQAKSTYDYEHKNATIFEVNSVATRISSTFYGIAVRMIGKLDNELSEVEKAINIIEEHNGLPLTKFEEDTNGTAESDDVQGEQEVTE